MTLFVVIVGFSCFALAPCSAANTFKYSEEQKLREYLVHVRDGTVLPVIDEAARVKFAVNLTIPPDHIMDLTLDPLGLAWLDLILCMQWNASSMMWDPQDFNNVTYTAFYSFQIWTPILEVNQVVIPQPVYDYAYWKRRMSVVTLRYDGYVEYCPQVHLPLLCSVEEAYDAFPAETFSCHAGISDMSPMSHIQNILIEEKTSIRSDWRYSFTGSGFELQYLTTERDKNSAILRAGLRRASSQWVYLVTIPVFLMSSLCLISLWLPGQRPVRSFTFCFVLIAILLFQIQLYSAHLVHCSKPPVVLSLLGQLVIGQLIVAILLVMEMSVENSQDAQQLYARLDFVYKHSVVHKYVEWTRVNLFGWAFEKFEDEMDLKDSHESLEESQSPTSLMFFCGTVIRSLVSFAIVVKTFSFASLFL